MSVSMILNSAKEFCGRKMSQEVGHHWLTLVWYFSQQHTLAVMAIQHTHAKLIEECEGTVTAASNTQEFN